MKFKASFSDAIIPFEKFLEKIRSDAKLKKELSQGKISDQEFFQHRIFKSEVEVTFTTDKLGTITYTLEGDVDDDALLNGIDAKNE